ncbi:hypothetical protein [uncultured Campylobacter sp.]|uniref:hypothetical protein n=1 Tax=uncultured Campylobacter sp. TaxID=218934 RepID=UPI00261BE240|nr:hypothetical protein [uncultured Campylobacter sp.]
MQFAAVKFNFRIIREMLRKISTACNERFKFTQKFKDVRRKFYKFSPPGYVPKCAVSVAQLAMVGVAAILSCV